MQGRSSRLLFAIATGLLTACAARSAAPQHPDPSTSASCSASTQARKRREMTWAEYYTDVVQRAEHNRAMIIWVNPPDVRVATNTCR